MLSLWQKKSDPPIQAMSLSWSVGNTIAPFILRPFLPVANEKHVNVTLLTVNNTLLVTGIEPQSQIYIAWSIASMLLATAAFLCLLIHICGQQNHDITSSVEKKRSVKDILRITKITGEPAKFVIPMCILFFCTYFFQAAAISVILVWMYTYAVESNLSLTPREAAIFDGANKGSYTAGRIMAIIMMKLVSPQRYLITSIWIATGMSVGILTLGPLNKGLFFSLACLFTFTIAPMWYGTIAFTDKYLMVTGVVYVFLVLGADSSNMISNWFIGWLFTNKKPETVLYTLAISTALTGCMISAMYVLGAMHGNRFDRQGKDKQEDQHHADDEDVHLSVNL